jgi:pyruvate/2-oxoacid:ferredoxin oxidoreductase beta subunit
MNDEDLYVVEAMEVYGGSFVQALAACFRRADSNNTQRLKDAFPEYWKQYTEMAEKIKVK